MNVTRRAPPVVPVLLWALFLLSPRMVTAGDQAVEGIEKKYSFGSQEAKQAGSGRDADAYEGLSASQLDRYHEYKMEQERNKLYDVGILSLVTLSSLLFVVYVITRKERYSSEAIVNVTGLIFIVYGTIVLTLMVDTDQQLTAAMGILGAVAGYLFGTSRRAGEREQRGIAGK